MKFINIEKNKWVQGIEQLKRSYQLIGPKKEKEFYNFNCLGKGELPALDIQNTHLSPKSIVFPQTETMFEYNLDESKPDCNLMKEVKKDYSPKAVIGIRPCDAASFLIVKRNFDSPEYKDIYWVKSYESTTFIGLACDNPCSTCFCTSAGCGPYSEDGLDVLLVDKGDNFLAKVLTTKGESFVNAANWQDEIASSLADKQIQTDKKSSEQKITASIAVDKIKGKDLLALYEAPFWEDETFSCINCGTCTYVCPTCWCFDIQDENKGCCGERMRNWDSCMYPLFTLHGSGHNPRSQKYQRCRQRFMHKLKYYVDKYGTGIQCVGCGRCIRLCPVNIDIRRISEKMNTYDSVKK